MKRNIAVITGLAGLLLALATPSFADEKGKEVKYTIISREGYKSKQQVE